MLRSLLSTSAPSTSRRRSPEDFAWRLFLVWTAIGFVVMPLGIDAGAVTRHLSDGPIRRFVLAILPVSDALWMALAAAVVYLHTAAVEGLPTARRWAAIILVGSGVAEWLGATTGFPFGPYRYTGNFGYRIGGVLPVAIPLAWLVVLLCGRSLVLRLYPQAARWKIASQTAFIAVLTDLNLEWIAWKVRGYWMWYPEARGPLPATPPLQNFVAWFVLAFLLVLALPPNHDLRPRHPHPWRPVFVLGLMNVLFLTVYLVRSLGFTAP